MVQVPSQLNYIVVATSQHLVIYYVEHAIPSKLVQVRHFRNSDDLSLQLHCYNDGDGKLAGNKAVQTQLIVTIDTLVSIRSDLNPTVLIYRLHLAGKSATTVGDPIELVLYAGRSMRSTGLFALHFSLVDIKEDFNKNVNGSKSNSDIQDVCFYQLTTLHKDYSVKQTLCAASLSAETMSKLSKPTWERDLVKSGHKVLDDDFIVNDDDADEVQEDSTRSEPVSNFVRRFRKPRDPDATDWTVNHELTERRLNNVDVSDVMSMDEALEAARDALNDGKTGNYLPFPTVKELVEIEVTLQNLESASSGLERLLLDHGAPKRKSNVEHEGTAEQQDATLTLQSIALLPILQIPVTGQDHLSAVYKSISGRWIHHMPENIADIVRHSKEQLARRMAAEILLACLIMRPPAVEPELQAQSQPQSQSQSQDQVWELPVRPGAPISSRTTPSMAFDAVVSPRSPRLPTPSETGSSSSVPASNPALARLSRYTTFTSKPTPAPLSRRLIRVLSHWPLGVDPASYDWASASRHIVRRDEEEAEGEEMTEKERQRQQRRTDRYMRRQRREAEETARLQLLSSQAPEIVVGSQSARLARASSQQATLGADSQSQSQSQGRLVASQVLPGPHGGRKPAKKKRKSGF
jgi:RNA polymerase I-specific transcription initiation factor RRN6